MLQSLARFHHVKMFTVLVEASIIDASLFYSLFYLLTCILKASTKTANILTRWNRANVNDKIVNFLNIVFLIFLGLKFVVPLFCSLFTLLSI